MFLIYFEYSSSPQSIIEYVLSFIRDNSAFVGGVVAVVTSSLWFYKLLKQKRAEAFFGFYARLLLRLKSLRAQLDANNQLNISDSSDGNIFSLVYVQGFLETICPSYKAPSNDELKLYQSAAKELKEILIETECNVYPPKAKRNQWYESQYILFDFCEFLVNDEYRNTTNKSSVMDGDELLHVKKCKKLINAMDYIQQSIENAKY